MKRTIENIKDPLYRFFEREVNLGSKLLTDVRQDFEDIVMICRGQKKQTNDHRKLTSSLTKGGNVALSSTDTPVQFTWAFDYLSGIVPESWVRYKIPEGVTVMQWLQDFGARVEQLQTVVDVVLKEQAKGLKVVLREKCKHKHTVSLAGWLEMFYDFYFSTK